jgi:hypothetical protein
MRKSVFAISGLALSVLAASGTLWAVEKPTEPTVDRTSIVITAVRRSKDESVGNWKWYPRIKFRVNGPISAGSQLSVQYSFPGGKPWISYQCETFECSADWWCSTSGGDNPDPFVGKETTYVGYVNFSIKMKNELEGTNKVLFSGKFRACKNPAGTHGNSLYYIDYDWWIPIGLLTYSTWEGGGSGSTGRVPDSAVPVVWMWFPGNNKTHPAEPIAYLYYNGKKVSSTTDADSGSSGSVVEIDYFGEGRCYTCYRFNFGLAYVYDNNVYDPKYGGNDLSQYFHLNKNPGEYEVKVLWLGKLVRTTKFTVGADGKIVDNGINAQSGLKTLNFLPYSGNWSDFVVVLPLKVLGNNGITYNADAWKTDAFWGNPMKGFSLPQ